MKAIISCICLSLLGTLLYSQIGGQHAFESTSLPTNARITALGGSLINVTDGDVALAQYNPAVTDSLMNNKLSVNNNFHFAGVQQGNVAYGKYLKKWGIASHAAIQYVNFGDFDQADEFGNITGEFSARETALVAGVAKKLNERIQGGINLKLLTGNYASYRSVAIGVDIGFHYNKPDNNSSWALVFKNIGGELSPLVDERKSLPFDLQLGYAKRLQHLPFRISVIGHNLQSPYIRYDDPDLDNSIDLVGNIDSKSTFSRNFDNLFRHLIISGEFLIGSREQFRLRFGYNHLRRQELRVRTFRSTAGFSFGVGFNIKKIRIDYGVGTYHLAGSSNHLSITFNMDRIFNKI